MLNVKPSSYSPRKSTMHPWSLSVSVLRCPPTVLPLSAVLLLTACSTGPSIIVPPAAPCPIPALATAPCPDLALMPEPPAFESAAHEVEWVVTTTLKTAAARGAAYRACEAKHQKVVQALEDCAERD